MDNLDTMSTLSTLSTLNTFSIPLGQFFDLNSTQHIDLPPQDNTQQLIQLPVYTINQPIMTKPISPPKFVLTQPVQALGNASQNSSNNKCTNKANNNDNNNDCSNNGSSISKNTVYKEKMTLKEGVIIQKAFESLRQILQNKKKKLEGLIDQCYQVGKIEYKMTIDSAPVRPEVIVNRLDRYEQKYLHDFRRLLLSNNAMEKLYSELLAGKTIKKVVAHAKMINPIVGSANQTIPQVHQDPSPNRSLTTSPDRTSNASSMLFSPSSRSIPPLPLLTGQKSSSILKSKPQKAKIGRPLSKQVARPSPRTKKTTSQTSISPSQGSPEQPTLSKLPSPPSPVKKSTPMKDPTDDKYHCEFCSKAFLRVQSLNIHLEFDHPPSTRMTISSPEGSPIRSSGVGIECKECGKNFLSPVLYNIHMKSFHYAKTRTSKSATEHNYSRRNNKSSNSGRVIRGGRIVKRKRGRPRVRAARKRSVSEASLSDGDQSSNSYSHQEPFFDPEIPFECSPTNPVVLITPLSQDIIDAYRRSFELPGEEDL
ncbi:uncharacterized protein LOC141853957 [Brevipalpus obovatus]|uniref:uncharacterized protein LOC141853957 n=1 Tax=Brevipalpus obovatus TaxID=246614 RepID=UPI003D9DCC05